MAVAAGAEELEATSAWLAVAVVRQRRVVAAVIGLAAVRAKRRACIF